MKSLNRARARLKRDITVPSGIPKDLRRLLVGQVLDADQQQERALLLGQSIEPHENVAQSGMALGLAPGAGTSFSASSPTWVPRVLRCLTPLRNRLR